MVLTRSSRSTFSLAVLCALAVVVCAGQWFVYDATRSRAEPFAYYVWWSTYIWALLTPAAWWLTMRFPITRQTWKRNAPFHLGASIALVLIQLSVEALFGWLRHDRSLSPVDSLRHYFSQHTQICLSAYWLVVAAAMAYRTHRAAQESELRSVQLASKLTEARLELLRTQLNPHFLFNTLQAAAALVHEDVERAEEVLSRLGDLLRVTLREKSRQEITLREELEVLSHYTAIQGCRFQDRLRFVVDAAPDTLECFVPSLILQPVVENAVAHGIGSHRSSDVVSVRARRNGTVLRIEIQNGVGSVNGRRERDGTGFGLAATRERLEQLYGDARASFALRALTPTGAVAELALPVRERGGSPSGS